MKALILDGSPAGDARTAAAPHAAVAELAARGCDVDRRVARDLDVRPCTGCFGCWVRHPGECVIDDDARDIAASHRGVGRVRRGHAGALGHVRQRGEGACWTGPSA